MSTAPKLAFSGLVVAVACASFALAADDSGANPAELVRRAVHNEIASNQNTNDHFMFKDLKKTPQFSQVKLLVETQEATAGLLVMQDGRPLNPQQKQAEDQRLQNYMQNTQDLRRKRKQEREDAEHTERILRALPDAFLYERDGTQEGQPGLGGPGDTLLQLNFRPNPNYNPPSHVEQVLTGMYGHLLIDTDQERIAEIDGTLKREVGFGWGILGHLDPGGRFVVHQADVGAHQWEVTRMELSFTGKILLVKKLNIRSSDVFSDFHPVSKNLTFAQGVDLLKKEAATSYSGSGAVQAENKSAAAQNKNKSEANEQADKTLCCDR
ncbi:MAG TPA: hypothetical protein VJO35_17940 [Terriglobales bacterium]|nr:hypothetical protein [Terriglobales bacterium]